MGKKIQQWFEVDLKGFRAIQSGKPKHYVLRELVQNALDEPITMCDIKTEFDDNVVTLTVSDDSAVGFRDLTDSFTLYKDTYKRRDPSKRGRFNAGEKQAFAICEFARIVTTKGTVTFDKTGRHHSKKASQSGTTVTVMFKATEKQYNNMVDMLKDYIIPEAIKFTVNSTQLKSRKPFCTTQATLTTEFEEGGQYHRRQRKTDINILDCADNQTAYLYEMGIPIQKIDCIYGIDVQQKVPMGIDRDTVNISFLQDVFAETLNVTYKLIPNELISASWVRLGSSDERASRDAVDTVIKKRFGDKVVIANPFDPIANDDALAHGYKVVSGREMSKEEWDKVKGNGLMQTSTAVFGRPNGGVFPSVEPNDEQKKFADLAIRLAKRIFDIEIGVEFVKGGLTDRACYGDRTFTVNVSRCNGLFTPEVTSEMLFLIGHEIAHEKGHHTEIEYHRALCRIIGDGIMTALKEPEFFNLKAR